MPPTLKLDFKEFIANALSNLEKTYTGIKFNPDTLKYMTNSTHDGPSECYQIPEYIEITIDLISIE